MSCPKDLFILLALLISSTVQLEARTVYESHRLSNARVTSTPPKLADFDNDGDMDLLMQSDSSLIFQINRGGAFDELVAEDLFLRQAQIVDFDGDGDQDIVGVADEWIEGRELYWLRNDCDFIFTRLRVIEQRTGVVFAADFNSDGNIDFVSSRGYYQPIIFWENDGEMNFLPHESNITEYFLEYSKTGDVDGDGDVDLVVVGGWWNLDILVWLENDGNGIFTEHLITDTLTVVDVIAVSHVNDSDEAAIFICTEQWRKLHRLQFSDDGFTDSEFLVEADNSKIENVDLVDMDLDGDDDLLFASLSFSVNEFPIGGLIWLEMNEDFQIIAEHDICQIGAQLGGGADLNGNGKIDIVGTLMGYPTWWQNKESHFDLEELAEDDQPKYYEKLLSFDYEGDGDTDIFTLSMFNSPTKQMLLFENDNHSLMDPQLLFENTDLWWTTFIPGDLNGDDLVDFVMHDGGHSIFGGDLTIALNEGDNFSLQPRGIRPTIEPLLFDIDNDGDLDIIGAQDNDPVVPVWWENNGDADFGGSIPLASGTNHPFSKIFLMDIDADGDDDLFATHPTHFIWYENDGDLTFPKHERNYNHEIQWSGGAKIVDLDQDGDRDIVGSYFWIENLGGGEIVQHDVIESTDERYPRVVETVDMDSDGDLDFISNYNEAVGWYENNGSCQFSHPRVLANVSPVDIVSADYDSDGIEEIVLSGHYFNPGLYMLDRSELGIVAGSIDPPSTMLIHDMYPNPFNSSVTISFELNETDNLSVRVVNVLGQQVWSEEKSFIRGRSEYDLDMTGYPSGIYFLEVGGKKFGNQWKKMMLLK
ncbi:T9SS type A sorting domain-containing protein [bacterium]|nr:T9SS type A sorting domain-containing protein [bacterium]